MEMPGYDVIPKEKIGEDDEDWLMDLSNNVYPDMVKKSVDKLRKIKGAFRRVMGLDSHPPSVHDFEIFKRTVFRRWVVEPFANYDVKNRPSEREVDMQFHQMQVVHQFNSDCAHYANLEIPSDKELKKEIRNN